MRLVGRSLNASNDSTAGRAENRRTELLIRPR